MTLRLAVISGSLRRESLNRRLARAAVAAAQTQGMEADFVDLGDYAMPFYDGDLEDAQGIPAAVEALRARLAQADACVRATPHYKGGIPGLLKTAFDWLSRRTHGATGLVPMAGRPMLLMAATPGAGGGARVLPQARYQFNCYGFLVLPQQFQLPLAERAFTGEAELADADKQRELDAALASLGRVARGLRSA